MAMSEENGYAEASISLGAIIGFITFAGCWVYCVVSYGFLFGVGIGWLPSLIVAIAAGFLAALLWPLAALVFLLLVASVIGSDLYYSYHPPSSEKIAELRAAEAIACFQQENSEKMLERHLAINFIISNGGDSADIVLGAGLAPWVSETLPWDFGEWLTGLSSVKAYLYRRALEAVVADAEAVGGKPFFDRNWLITNEIQTAQILIDWNHWLDGREGQDKRDLLTNAIVSRSRRQSVEDDLAAIRQIRANLPTTKCLSAKVKLLEYLPPVLARDAKNWDQLARGAGARRE